MSSCASAASVHLKHIPETLFDLQSIPVLRKKTHLPVVIDPSHAGGKWWLVEPMAKAAGAAGADGLMIEVHNNPGSALFATEHSH